MSTSNEPSGTESKKSEVGEGKAGKGKGPEGLTSLLSLIPSVYYDLIARVAPGLTLVSVIALHSLITGSLTTDGLSHLANTPALIAGLLISYVLGMILTGVAFIWDFVSLFILEALRCKPMTNPVKTWTDAVGKMDSVAKEDEAAGSTLGKMMAETSLCENLLSGLLLLAVVGKLSCGEYFYDPCQNFGGYAAAAALLLVAVLYRQKAFIVRVESMHKTHCDSEQPAQSHSPINDTDNHSKNTPTEKS